jgi:TonB-linked SusC/RagA family outer membrane protein
MKFNLTNVFFFLRKKLIVNIMRTFIFLFCTTIFGFSPGNLFSQNTKIVIATDKTVTVDEVFDMIKQQTDYTFIYQEDLFKKLPKVHLKKGVIGVNELLQLSLSKKDFDFNLTSGNTIIVKEVSISAVAQKPAKITIKGVVTGSSGEPLPGVNIKVRGTNVNVQSNFDGRYTIEAADDDVMLFTYIGYISQIVAVNGRKEINVVLKKELKELGDVVINTGVTQRKKELVTGSISVYRGEELRQVSTQNAIQALKTLDPSFILVDNNIAGSNPNALPTIEVRGKTSLTVNQVNEQFGEDANQPLFILDGFPTTLQQVVDLDINRIASITLLKDAASTALYGSRSANGVVVIETIKPVAGKLQFSYVNNSSFEIADLSVYHLMNAGQKLEFERLSGAYNAGIGATAQTQYAWDQVYNNRLAAVRRGVNTYWLNDPIQMGITSGHSMSIGGGSEEFRFNIAGNYKSLSGTMKGSERNTWGFNTTLTYRKNKFQFSNNLTISGGNNQESPYGSFATYAKASPYYPKYNEYGVSTPYLDGSSVPYIGPNTWVNQAVNPLYNVFLSSFDKGNNFNFTNNLAVNYDLSSHIRTTAALSVSKINTYGTIFVSPEDTRYINNIATEKGSYTRNEAVSNNWNANIGATYSNTFKDVHSFNYTIRASAQERRNNSFGSILRGFPTGVPANPAFAFGFEANSKPTTYTDLIRTVDLTNQINYAYDKRFLLDLTQTISGSTNFGTNNKYSPYWGVGLGWNLNNEFKMNEDIVNILKLRANIGQTGNQNLVGFASHDIYVYEANTNIFGAGLGISQLANADLEPQRTKDLSVGIDLAMFKNRLTGTFGAYNRQTSPQIVAVNLAASTGVTSYPLNVGYITTKGLELKLNYNFIYKLQQNFIWGVGLTSSLGNNKLGGFNNALASLNEAAKKTTSLTRYYDGASSDDLWAVPSLGIDPATGREVFLKKDGQSTFILDKADEVVMGNSREKATGVVSTNVTYKNFSFGLYMRYSFGADAFNNALYNKVENIGSTTIFDNQDERAFTERWLTPGQLAEFKGIGLTNSTPISSRFIQKNDYLSGESIRIGYKVTDKAWLNKAGLSALGVNALANEFFRWSTIKAERGIDYPFSRIYTLSLNVSF